MGQSYFIWNGADCRSKGITLAGPVPIVRPEERVQHVEIPGRSGDLTLLEGEQIYNSYIQTASISVRGGFRVREVYKWLRGSGYVTFSGEPDRRQAARIVGAVTLNRISRNLDIWSGEVQIYCQPLKELLNPVVASVNRGGSVMNLGDVPARSQFRITATGSTAVLTVGSRSITVTGLTSGNVITIDSDMMEVFDGSMITILTADSTGEFPFLEPGANTIGGSGWSTATIDKRERFL